jgi:hypothetical protein
VSLAATDTIISKRKFERFILESGRATIKEIRADNGVFTSEEFERDVMEHGQQIRFSGVGAHHQNGVAERNIKTVVEMARCMMQHSALHWPDAFNEALWPYAMDYACWLWNNTPHKDSGVSPMELLSQTHLGCEQISRARVWGCPAYVLDPKLQDGKKIPKWRPRSRGGQFLGFSQEHSSTVALVLNFKTGSFSPQFHVVFDEKFETVYAAGDTTISPVWI